VIVPRVLSNLTQVLDFPRFYQLWQAPFVAKKLRPFLAENPRGVEGGKVVVELGCGPATNAGNFMQTRYRGWDLNEGYIQYARRRCPSLLFSVGDVTQPVWFDSAGSVDVVFMNSLLHHLSDTEVQQVLGLAHEALKEGGEIHIMDLVLPHQIGIGQILAKADRGLFPRSLESWRGLFSGRFETVSWFPYTLDFFGIQLWHMVYWRGRKAL